MINAFEGRLHERWKDGLEGLEAQWLCAMNEAKRIQDRHVVGRDDPGWVLFAMMKLHGRACRTVGEILALLRSGYPDAANARWRTLHELTVTMFFISAHGEALAERYMLHHEVRLWNLAQRVHNLGNDEGVGWTVVPAELAEIKTQRDALVKRFGTAYKHDYGWAAEALDNPKPNFFAIEKSIEMDRSRPLFQEASEAVHAGSRGLAMSLGDPFLSEKFIVGASNAGLSEPGAATSLSLSQATIALLACRPDLRGIHAMEAIQRLGVKVEDAFEEAELQLFREEEHERREGRGGSYFRGFD